MAIVDTKWKRLSPAIEDLKHGVSQADVYQMMAYGRLYGCPELVLLYPHHVGLGETRFAADYAVNASKDRLRLRTVDIARDEAAVVAELVELARGWSIGRGEAGRRPRHESIDHAHGAP